MRNIHLRVREMFICQTKCERNGGNGAFLLWSLTLTLMQRLGPGIDDCNKLGLQTGSTHQKSINIRLATQLTAVLTGH